MVHGIERTANGFTLQTGAGTLSADNVLIATGSEVEIAAEAQTTLAGEGLKVRLVSMPCVESFTAQPAEYQDAVLPPEVTARVSIEAGVTDYWYRFTGPAGARLGVDTFGESGPYKEVYAHFGLTAEALASSVRNLIGANASA